VTNLNVQSFPKIFANPETEILKSTIASFLGAKGNMRARSSARIEHRAFKLKRRNPGVLGSIPGGPATIRYILQSVFRFTKQAIPPVVSAYFSVICVVILLYYRETFCSW
jgi:hypothetical protein